jgi:hypothetical protein
MHACNSIEFQQQLSRSYLRELGGPEGFDDVPEPDEYPAIHHLENEWNQFEEGRLGDLTSLPTNEEAFKLWYHSLHLFHRKKVASFFDYLAERATPEELALYIRWEEQVDGRFDDVIALAQLGMNPDMKLVLAENFWDEMGQGDLHAMHTIMFAQSARYMSTILSRNGTNVTTAVPAAAIKNGNLLLMYALRRRYTPRLLGALTILEHTAPYRFSQTVRGLRRVGVPEDAIRYHELHIGIDANHGNQLFERILTPLVANNPKVMREVCVGCLIRFHIAIDYYRSVEEAIACIGSEWPFRRISAESDVRKSLV